MAVSNQASMDARPVTEFGVTEEGVDELIEALNDRRKNAAGAAAYRKADKTIKDAMPMVDEPTRVRISDIAEVTIGVRTQTNKARDEKEIIVRRKDIRYL